MKYHGIEAIAGRNPSRIAHQGVQSEKVIFGKIRFDFKNPVTGEVSDAGPGIVLYDKDEMIKGRYFFTLLVQKF